MALLEFRNSSYSINRQEIIFYYYLALVAFLFLLPFCQFLVAPEFALNLARCLSTRLNKRYRIITKFPAVTWIFSLFTRDLSELYPCKV